MTDLTQERLRSLHRERMELLGEWADSDWDREHQADVVERAMQALAGEADEPWLHSHAGEEAGVCTDCDAARLLQIFREGVG